MKNTWNTSENEYQSQTKLNRTSLRFTLWLMGVMVNGYQMFYLLTNLLEWVFMRFLCILIFFFKETDAHFDSFGLILKYAMSIWLELRCLPRIPASVDHFIMSLVVAWVPFALVANVWKASSNSFWLYGLGFGFSLSGFLFGFDSESESFLIGFGSFRSGSLFSTGFSWCSFFSTGRSGWRYSS